MDHNRILEITLSSLQRHRAELRFAFLSHLASALFILKSWRGNDVAAQTSGVILFISAAWFVGSYLSNLRDTSRFEFASTQTYNQAMQDLALSWLKDTEKRFFQDGPIGASALWIMFMLNGFIWLVFGGLGSLDFREIING